MKDLVEGLVWLECTKDLKNCDGSMSYCCAGTAEG